MKSRQRISPPARSIPLAVPIGLCSIILLASIAYAVHVGTYDIAITELREHEIIDLADETRKNADGLKATLSKLREDVLTLSLHPMVHALVDGDIVTEQALRSELSNVFIRQCMANASENVTAGIPDWKDYMQVRLIDADGHERIRVQRVSSDKQDGLMTVPLDQLDAGAAKGEKSAFYKGGKTYFSESRRIFEEMRDTKAPLRIYLSEIEFNQESDTKSPMHNILTIRAAVPLTRRTGEQLEFRGILIVNLDVNTAIRYLTDAARHLVYLGTGEADPDSTRAKPKLLYNPEFLTIQNSDDRQQQENGGESEGAVASPIVFEDFEKILRRDIEDCAQFEKEFNAIFSNTPERAEQGASNNSVLPFADRGQRFPNDALSGKRLTLNPANQFYLMKLDVAQPTDPIEAAEFRAKLSEELQKVRSNSVRVPPLVRANANAISIRAASARELKQLIERLESFDSYENYLTRKYDEPVLCKTFAAHFYRIYFDPARPQRYLALLVGFSDEELTADLASTRRAAFLTFFVATILGGAVFVVLLWWFVTRPIQQLTSASASIARGQYETKLPTGKRDEIGTLARTFALMVREVQERDLEIRRQNEDLDEKVKSRTASLAEARDQLEAAVNARDAFLATVSHELRTPLNHIYGYAQLLEITDLDEEQRSDLEKLQGSSRHLLRLVQDILDYQKIIMGRLPVSPVMFDVRALLQSVRESNQSKAAQRNNQLLLEMHSVDEEVFNDENRLRQILDNLVGNACKFTTDGSITIHAKDDGDCLEIAVQDTGVGISEEGMGLLFQPFSKVASSGLNPDGTGLGLVISRELARKMGGDLTVTSVPQRGATFVTRILRKMPSAGGESQHIIVESDTLTTITELKPKNDDAKSRRQSSNQVLVIDDDPSVREMISRFLTEEGLQVIVAASGAEGIEMAARHRPSVITLDLVMPDVDGWSVLAALKANSGTADIPVVLVTVLDDPQKGYSFGAAEYLAKPIEGDRLAQVVRRYCDTAPTILIIDDNSSDREIVRRVLKNGGCSVVEASDGAEALKLFEETHPDLIILDLMMPVMDGFTFLEELRKQSHANMPPIVVLTAKDMTADNRDRLNGMVSEVIQKGHFDRRRLLQEIQRQLGTVRRPL